MKPEMEKGSGSESKDAARDLLAAIASKDAAAVDLALKRHYACCEGMDDEDDEAADGEDY